MEVDLQFYVTILSSQRIRAILFYENCFLGHRPLQAVPLLTLSGKIEEDVGFVRLGSF